MGTTTIGIGVRHGNTCCMCCGVQSADGDSCYCNCCACVPTGPLTFEMVRCEIRSPMVKDCSCTDFTFEMGKGSAQCYYHSDGEASPGGGGCTPCQDQYQNQPTGAYIESWGFSGTVCGDCTSSAPPMSGDDCGGMCITASLCCCKTGIVTSGGGVPDHPCPIQSAETCSTAGNGLASGVTPESLSCRMECFWFEIEPFNCYNIMGGGLDSPCSPCAAYTGDASFPQTTPGSLSPAICHSIVSGQCASPTQNKKFMLMVEGSMNINCDCQTGVVIPMNTPPIMPVAMHYTGLITES
jgi:hypothetical protein